MFDETAGEDRLCGFFDFYFAGTDTLLFDIAVCLNDWCADLESGRLDETRAAAFMLAYQAVRPLAGAEAILPVKETVVHTHASPRAAVGFLAHAASLDRAKLGPRIALNMPGVTCTVGEQIESLRRIAGDKVVARIRREPDEAIIKIVSGWSERIDPKRALQLGFTVEKSFDEIIRIHIEDELGGKIAA